MFLNVLFVVRLGERTSGATGANDCRLGDFSAFCKLKNVNLNILIALISHFNDVSRWVTSEIVAYVAVETKTTFLILF